MQQLIKLTEKGVNSGPYYDVYYSLDLNTYVFVTTIYLPFIDATSIITIPDTTVSIKLVSTGVCNNNVIRILPDIIQGDFNADYNPYDFN